MLLLLWRCSVARPALDRMGCRKSQFGSRICSQRSVDIALLTLMLTIKTIELDDIRIGAFDEMNGAIDFHSAAVELASGPNTVELHTKVRSRFQKIGRPDVAVVCTRRLQLDRHCHITRQNHFPLSRARLQDRYAPESGRSKSGHLNAK